MRGDRLSEIIDRLRNARRILVTSHVSPDGDAVGGVLALYHVVRGMNDAEVVCALADPVPHRYDWLPGADLIRLPRECLPPFDLAVIVDVAQLDRIGEVMTLLDDTTQVIVLDHHLEDEPAGNLAVVDPRYAATGELLIELMDAAGVALTEEIAVCAYVALTTDTGSFKYSNTTERSHKVAARLVATGLPVAEIGRRVFDEMPARRFRLLTRFVNNVVLLDGGRIALGTISARDMAETEALDEDTEGLINFARNIEGVDVAMLLREVDEHTVKLSMRSREGLNSAEILKPLGGGGHGAAAGATLEMSLRQAMAFSLRRVREVLSEKP
ncbi:MAG TPA: DHH family phosphoesterase [Candidatus Hydrogenedentes bacterium]|nr:DHH family phosphoesterase [Candidatus Hydrogenedentota bacterium]